MPIKHAWPGLTLLLIAGCYAPVLPDIDRQVCDSAQQLADAQAPGKNGAGDQSFTNLIGPYPPPPPGTTLKDRLKVPSDLAGADAKDIVMPDLKGKKLSPAEIEKLTTPIVNQYFPAPSDVGSEPQAHAVPGPKGQPLTLADLQELACANSPLLRQAAANVQAARGAMIQAGLYPNPTLGLEGITAGPSGGPTLGPFLGQTITTMGKLKLAQSAAQMDLENAQLAYRRAETDLTANVRSGYFAVLVADENIRQMRALVALTDEVYKVMVQQLKHGEFATYEPMQVGVFAAQARAALIQARNSYVLAWTQLAANLGLPGMPATQLAGRIRDMPLPNYRYDTALAHVLEKHTDVVTAGNTILKARYNLRLAEVTAVPDVSVQASLTNDETPTGPNRIVGGMQVSVPVPVWHRNEGNIWQARAQLVNAIEEPHRVRDALTSSVAEAYRRYLESLQLLELYRKEILPKQVQAFRSVVKRHYGGELGGVAYTDLVSSEQTLVTVIGNYIPVLQTQWQAVSDLASLLQTDDIYQLAEGQRLMQPPDLTGLLPLPCCHPCSSLQDPALKGQGPDRPETGFGPAARTRLTAPVLDDSSPSSGPVAPALDQFLPAPANVTH